MTFAPPTLVGTMTFLLYAVGLLAEEAKPAPSVPAVEPKLATHEAPATAPATLSSAILAGLPRYVPSPAPTQKRPAAVDDETEIVPEDRPLGPDQPTNKIIRLPHYVVEGNRPPVFRESELYSRKAFGRILAKRYFSELERALSSLSIFGSLEGRALERYEAEERLQNIAELKEDAALARLAGDKAEAQYILRETNRTFLRSGGMDWNTWHR